MAGEALSSWQTFLTAMLSVAEVQGYCRLSDSRLSVIPLEKKGQGLGLFVLNSTRRPVAADIIFQEEVSVSISLARFQTPIHCAPKRNPVQRRPIVFRWTSHLAGYCRWQWMVLRCMSPTSVAVSGCLPPIVPKRRAWGSSRLRSPSFPDLIRTRRIRRSHGTDLRLAKLSVDVLSPASLCH